MDNGELAALIQTKVVSLVHLPFSGHSNLDMGWPGSVSTSCMPSVVVRYRTYSNLVLKSMGSYFLYMLDYFSANTYKDMKDHLACTQ